MKAKNPPAKPDGIGIDFGTTNSVIAKAIRSGQGVTTGALSEPHPSVVWYQPNESPKVGKIAKDNLLGFSEAAGNYFVSSVKQTFGKENRFSIFGRKVTSTDVASEIFTHLKHNAKITNNLDVTEAVVTIPIDFDGRARQELRKAADLAGIYIKTFIHEPFAAIVGYCYGQKDQRTLLDREGENILVFDWGGGTLDVTLGRIEGNSLVELGTKGLAGRSGDYFDGRLSNEVKSQFIKRQKISADELKLTASTKDRLRAECEKCKISLSELTEHEVMVAQFYRNGLHAINLEELVERSTFEGLIRNDVQEAIGLIDSVLDQAGLKDSDVDLVLLIGGTSRIPLVRGEMYNRFGTKMVHVKNADTIIAEGAAAVDALGLYPALARTVCVELSDESHYEIFKAGDLAKPDVCYKEVLFFCTDNRDGQARLVVKEKLGRSTTRFETKDVLSIPVSAALPKPFNHERVRASFALDDDLILRVSASGAIFPAGAQTEIYDLCFSLKA